MKKEFYIQPTENTTYRVNEKDYKEYRQFCKITKVRYEEYQNSFFNFIVVL